MSSRETANNANEIIISTNTVIQENLNKLYQKMTIIRSDLIEDEDDEYENFYNRISFYFSSIINELKLKFIESVKNYQNEINILKDKNAQNEKDIMELMMENMILKIEKENYEEKNMLNITNYFDNSPKQMRISSNDIKNNFYLQEKKIMSNKRIISRNKANRRKNNTYNTYNINTYNTNNTNTNDDISFKTELKSLNFQIKKKIAVKCALQNHQNISNSNIEIKKKPSFTNFFSHAIFPSNQSRNVIKSSSPNKINKISQTGAAKYYKSLNTDSNIYNNNRNNSKNINEHYNNYLTGEKSMCNLPSYSLGKVKNNENKMKFSLNDLNNNPMKISKNKFINIISSPSNKNQRTKSRSAISISNPKNRKGNYTQNNKSTSSLNHNSNSNNALFSNDFEKYKSNLMKKITSNLANSNINTNNNNTKKTNANSNNRGMLNLKFITN